MAQSASACLWDSDTLAYELKQFPGVQEVITGRFDRNPPLYYQMRLDRVTSEIKTNPTKLELYDDAAVACDRLNRDDEAIKWMERKKAILDRTPNKEHLYRYYANLGTFHVHFWARHGADRNHMEFVDEASDEIAQAIEINPDAHFGRERYQLIAIRWISEGVPGGHSLSPYIQASDKDYKAQDAVRGLCGLVVLGGAAESVDVFAAIRDRIPITRGTLAYFAQLRVIELLDHGATSLSGSENEYRKYFNLTRDPTVKDNYKALRREADAYEQSRTDYMLALLKQGRHPDTDHHFWDGFREIAPPQAKDPNFIQRFLMNEMNSFFASLALVIAVSAAPIWLVRRWRRANQ